jgi:hypothetical protein
MRSSRHPLVDLVLHVLHTSVAFSAILLLAWGVSFLMEWLHALHPFPPETYRFLAATKRSLVYFDVGLAAVGLLSGTMRFIKETWEAKCVIFGSSSRIRSSGSRCFTLRFPLPSSAAHPWRFGA